MAITTGTPWDLALNQRVHRAPAGVRSAAPPRSLTVPPGTDAPPGTGEALGAGALSARAAYQQALYRRARIVDIRTEAERDRWGSVHDVPGVAEIDRAALVEWLVEHRSGAPVVLLSQEGAEAAAVSSALAEVGLPPVVPVDGGFLAWSRAGLPVRTR